MEIDYAGVKARLECDDELLLELLEAFHDDAPSQLEELRSSLDADDSNGAEIYAHALKGMSGNIGADRFRSIVVEMENSVRTGDFVAARKLYLSLAEGLELVLAEIGTLPCHPEYVHDTSIDMHLPVR